MLTTLKSPHFLLSTCIGALTVLFFIGVRYGEPPWVQQPDLITLGSVLALSFIIGLVFVKSNFCATTNLLLQVFRISAIASMVCIPVLMTVILTETDFQKLTLLIEFSLVYFLLLLNGLSLPTRLKVIISSVILAIGLQPALNVTARNSLGEFLRGEYKPTFFTSEYIFSPLHDLNVTTFKVIPDTSRSWEVDQGGAIGPIDATRALLVDGNGEFYILIKKNQQLTTVALKQLKSPMNRGAYQRDVEIPHASFRITDLLILDLGVSNQRQLYIAHHQWDESNKCITLNIDEATLELSSLNKPLKWHSRFQTAPCLPISLSFSNETGGRLAQLSDNSLLLTVGITIPDKNWDSSNPDISYGKIIEIDRHNWTTKVYSTGHRNPQGLLIEDNMIWSTEHGPNGGDELNLITAGTNYGWPESSYGVDYGKKTYMGNSATGKHSIGERPVYSWVPSIGIARLLRVKGKGFPNWQNDLLIGSLSGKGNGKSIYRVRLHESIVKTVERIEVGERVRDLIEMENGDFLTWDGKNIVQIISPASHVFSECIGCHVANDGFTLNGIGPDLWNIVGQPVASVHDYAYSNAMKDFGGRWSKERLELFLQNPGAVIPGTSMTFSGIEDATKRQEIIEYLEQISRR